MNDQDITIIGDQYTYLSTIGQYLTSQAEMDFVFKGC